MDASNGGQGAGPRLIHGDGNKTAGGIYFAKGPEFHLKFMAGYIMPFRREVAQMAVASMIQAGSALDGPALALEAYAIADALCLQERLTLDAKMAEYWELYMSHSKDTDDVMRAVEESHADYSLDSN